MYISATTLDDLLRRVLTRLLDSKVRVSATRGASAEITGALLQLSNPLARLSRSESKRVLFSCLGELLWYLAGSRDLSFIEYYLSRYAEESDDGVTVHGAYGPRLFKMRGHNQIANIQNLLSRKPQSRRAVIQLFDAEDLTAEHKDVPCTCTLQFMIRDSRLHLFTSMRSNDAYLGLPHDIFAFTMLQEIIARSLNVDVGTYKHAVGSLHLYDKNRNSARTYLREGWQETIAMPPMPSTDPWPAIAEVKKAERAIRKDGPLRRRTPTLDPYWMDIVRLLLVFGYFKKNDAKAIGQLRKQMAVPLFDTYIEQKRRSAQRKSAGSTTTKSARA